MTDNDVFNKLSQIIATHEADGNDGDKMNAILSRFDFDGEEGKKTKMDHAVRLPDRPTPFEVWKNKQTRAEKYVPNRKKVDKMTTTQVEKMIGKMHANNRAKHEEAIRIQNEGLKSELEGYEFKPRINQTSLDLAATMKPIAERMPEMVAEKQRILARKREDRDKEEQATASFKPTRQGAKTSDKYLKRMGRSAMARPEDFFLYHQEKIRRNEQRKNIIENIEAREMVFTPQLPETSRRIHEKMLTGPTQKISYDPVTRTTKVLKNPNRKGLGGSRGGGSDYDDNSEAGLSQSEELVEGPALVLESEHPYSHNRNEYTTVGVPGAVSYEITFSEETSTEPVHDFVRFLKYDDQTVVIGSGKYSGGMMDSKLPVKKLLASSKTQRYNITRSKETQRTPCNWPGVGGREPLIINASKFVVHFKTNGQLNDWGFRMNIVPTIHAPSAEVLGASGRLEFKPNISSKGSSYSNSLNTTTGKVTNNIFERLYADAVTSGQKKHNTNVQNIQSKTKIMLKPWEQARQTSPGEIHAWTANKTHTGKSLLGPALNELLIFDDESRYHSVALVEHGVVSEGLWNSMQNALIDENLALQLDDEVIDSAAKGKSYRAHVDHGRKSFGDAVANNEDYSDFSKMKMSDF